MNLHGRFIEQIETLFPGDAKSLVDAIVGGDAVTSIRVNNAKTSMRPGIEDRVPWCEEGYYLPGHESFTFDPLFHAGLYYVQDASSMIISYIVRSLVNKPVKYLDLCAAPGGKTTAALSALPPGSLMVCNEVVPQRAAILKENVMKWGYANCIVASDDSSRWGNLTHYFDVVAADVPCSGEGMFRKDDTAVEQWTPALVAQCAERQRLIIDNVWDAIAPGGLLIYSTCTYNRCENEDIVKYIIAEHGAEPVRLDMPREWDITAGVGGEDYCYRFLPHKTRGEGLFVCVLRKPGEESCGRAMSQDKRRSQGRTVAAKIPDSVKNWLCGSGDYTFSMQGGSVVTAMPEAFVRDSVMIQSKVKTLSCGVEVGVLKGKDIVPVQSLALATALNRGAFATVEVGYAEAISYLRGDVVMIGDAPRGIVLLLYQGVPIGFVKQLGNRANNLYPREWRIRSTYVPVTPPQVIVESV